jgi:hypothetical protein
MRRYRRNFTSGEKDIPQSKRYDDKLQTELHIGGEKDIPIEKVRGDKDIPVKDTTQPKRHPNISKRTKETPIK